MQKKVTTDVMWSIAALVLMNGVLQLAVYPLLNRFLGEETFGDVLYILGILAIIAPAIGLAANNVRLLLRKDFDVQNGDFLRTIALLLCLCTPVFLGVCTSNVDKGLDYVLLVFLLIFTTGRYYGDVEYRMSLNYRGYFFYYAVISAGYLLGIALYPLTKNWVLCILTGELLCNLLVAWTGRIYRPISCSVEKNRVRKEISTLACSYFLYNGVLNLDRIMVQKLVGSEAVTVYYVASLLGKTMALLVGPLNSIIISYATKSNFQIGKKLFARITGLSLAVGLVLFAGIVLVNPIFVGILYPAIVGAVKQIYVLASLSQVICFISSLLLTIVLLVASTRWQLLIQSIYAVVFLAAGIIGVSMGQMTGFVCGTLLANCVRLLLIILVGLVLLSKTNSKG